jgi:hypothetical protein
MNRDDLLAFAGAVVFALLLLAMAATMAGAEPLCPKTVSCWKVKAAVATFGKAAAEAHVRSCGWSEAQIVEAKRCLK